MGFISLTLAPLAKTQLKSEFLPILLRVNAYQCCIPFCFSTEQNRTHKKILPIERNRMFGNRTVQQSNIIEFNLT